MNEFKLKVLKLFLNHPFDYYKYLSLFNNKDYAFRIIKSLIPTDTGVEWEIGTLMVDVLKNTMNKNRKFIQLELHHESFEVSYRIHGYSLQSELLKVFEMYQFMNKPFNNDKRLDKSGIHIHTNLPVKFNFSSYYNMINSNETSKILNNLARLISYGYFEYKGSYNSPKFGTLKGNSIIYRRDLNTIEYRCINMTYNFRTLLKHIIVCHMITSFLIKVQNSKHDDIIDNINKLTKNIKLIKTV